MHITAGSTGYNNLSDKPDLSGFQTKADFKIEADQIHGEVGQINTKLGGTQQQLGNFRAQVNQNVKNLINRANAADTNIYALKTAGFLTKDGVNAWWSAGLTEKGEQVASYISQSPTAIKMISEHLDINAIATFRSYKSAIGNIVSSNRDGVAQNRTTAQNALTSAQNAQTAAQKAEAAINRLPAWAKKNRLKEALESETIIVGGFIDTSLINAKALNVEVAKVGGFNIEGNTLTAQGFNNLWGTNQGVRLDPFGGIVVRNGDNLSSQLSASGLTTVVYGGSSIISGSTIYLSRGANTFDVIIAHLKDDPDWHEYVQFKTKGLPHKNHIAAGGGANFKNVVIDINSGLLGWE